MGKTPSSSAPGWFRLAAAALSLGPAGAEEKKPEAAAIPAATAVVAVTVPAATDAARGAARLPPQAVALLATTRPKYELPKSFAAPAAVPAEGEFTGDDILHLPRLLVRGRRLPQPRELLTTEGKLDAYLGPKDGLDRGALNFYTLQWGSGFVRLALFDAVKNESRAHDRFAAEERKRTNEQLRNVLRWADLSEGDPLQLNREIEKTLSAQKPLPGK